MLKRLISTSVLVVLVGAASGANAFTTTADKRTYFTFSQPVALPGVTLPAGTYLFRLADDTTTRKVINVQNQQGTESLAMLHSMPAYRTDPPNEPEVRFMETAAGAPVAIRAWWAPGETTGYAFIYSDEQLAALNRGAAAAAPSAEANIESADAAIEAEAGEPVAEGPLEGPDVIDGPGFPAEESEEAVEQVAQLPPSEQAPPPAQAPAADAARQETREELPQTASPLALLLLGGLVSTGVGLRLLRKA